MIIQPKNSVNGTITVPGDKSISHRSIMFGALAKGKTSVTGFLNGADCLSTASCFKNMGITINFTSPTTLTIKGKGLYGLTKPSSILDVGNSGTTMRLMSGILAGQNFESQVTGDASIQKRPMKRIITPLEQMNTRICSQKGFAPLTISPSQLNGITYHSPVASAQVKSCIMLATLYANSPSTVIEPSLSRNHSELMLGAFGADVQSKNNTIYIANTSNLEGIEVDVPADISSAAYFIVAGLLCKNSEIRIQNVGINPTRDGILKVMQSMNGNIEYDNIRTVSGELRADLIVRSSSLTPTTVEGDIIPTLIDELPVVAVAAACAEGITVIKDAKELRVKESDRIETMVTELTKMGVHIEGTPDGMIIDGTKSKLKGATVESYHDHRVAMALAVAGLVADGSTIIQNPSCVDISFPSFYSLLASL